MTEVRDHSPSLEQFEAKLGEENMIGQWQFEPLLDSLIGGPQPRGDAFVWPWATTRKRLAEASRTLGESGVGRCNLTFLNPALPPGVRGSTHTLAAGIQMVRPHEVCWSHRHTMSALRFVIEGHPEAFTAVDGEQLTMDTFDLVLTPRMSWHDHHNPSDDEVVWLDVLDLGLTMGMNQAFYENFGDATQPLHSLPASTQALRQQTMRPAWERPRETRLAVRYPWSDVVAAFESFGDSVGDPYDGLALRYANPVTGGPTMDTMDCWVQQLAPGFAAQEHRRTSSSVGLVIAGDVRLHVGATVLDLSVGDTFAIPNYAWHHLENVGSATARIFTVHDIPAVQALGLFYEEPVATVGAHAAPGVPGVPHRPVYRTDAFLAGDESR